MTRPIGLQPDDLAQVMASFGVAEAQVRRDHAISHILAALSRHRREDVIFIGGTALSRTYLLDQRLSEDIDLIALDDRDDSPPQSWMFKRAPSAAEWQAQLAGQTRLTVTASEALEAVRTAWAAAVGEHW